MTNPEKNFAGENAAADNQSQAVDSKKPYATPKLQRYGGLAELVQLRPNRGRDGEVRWVDCTRT